MIDYGLIHLVHKVAAIQNLEETDRRLREVRSCPYPHDKRCKALAKVLQKKGGMSQTELDILYNFPAEGINIGYVSYGLIFGSPLQRATLTMHKAIVSLIQQRALVIVEGYRTDRPTPLSQMEQIIVRV